MYPSSNVQNIPVRVSQVVPPTAQYPPSPAPALPSNCIPSPNRDRLNSRGSSPSSSPNTAFIQSGNQTVIPVRTSGGMQQQQQQQQMVRPNPTPQGQPQAPFVLVQNQQRLVQTTPVQTQQKQQQQMVRMVQTIPVQQQQQQQQLQQQQQQQYQHQQHNGHRQAVKMVPVVNHQQQQPLQPMMVMVNPTMTTGNQGKMQQRMVMNQQGGGMHLNNNNIQTTQGIRQQPQQVLFQQQQQLQPQMVPIQNQQQQQFFYSPHASSSPSSPPSSPLLPPFQDNTSSNLAPGLRKSPPALLVFVNSKSGGQQGKSVITAFNALFPPGHVFDLMEEGAVGPKAGLLAFQNKPDTRILVCGGDGTVGWVLTEMLPEGKPPLIWPLPPVAILPLGTGNDLARALGWGPGYRGEAIENILSILEWKTSEVLMDRWRVVCTPLDSSTPPKSFIMNNYFSIGVDAKIALEFHEKREKSPNLFCSRTLNKGWYGGFGLRNMVSRPESLDDSGVSVCVNGTIMPLTAYGRLESVVLLNINSFAAGADLWGTKLSCTSHVEGRQLSPPSFSDGLLEVAGLTGVAHLTKIQTKMGSAKRMAQAQTVVIDTIKDTYIQVDGEPMIFKPGTIVVSRLDQVKMLLAKDT